MEGLNLIVGVVCTSSLWSLLYGLLQVFNKTHCAEWNCRLVTALHATTASILCFVSAFVLGPWPFHRIGEESDSFQTVIIVVSCGYFLFDFAWCLYMQTEDLVMLAHHALSLYGFAYSLYYNRYGCEMVTVMGSSEFTNPLLQLRWVMKQCGMYHGTREVLVDWTFFALFWAARVVVGTVYFSIIVVKPDFGFIPKTGGFAFYVISLVFWTKILLYLLRKYSGRRPTSPRNKKSGAFISNGKKVAMEDVVKEG